MTEYLWVWLAAFVMGILYTIMFLVMRRLVIIGTWGHGTGQPAEMETEEGEGSNAVAKLML